MEQAYLDLGRKILAEGNDKSDRTGTGTRSVFGHQMRFDLSQGFPLLTTKRVPFGLIKSELLWFLKGDTNIRYLLEHNNHIWDEWAFERYIKSDAYTGHDMTDFGRRSLVDEAFNEQYQHELKLFCEKILADDAFAETFGDLPDVPNESTVPSSVPYDCCTDEHRLMYGQNPRLLVQFHEQSGALIAHN